MWAQGIKPDSESVSVPNLTNNEILIDKANKNKIPLYYMAFINFDKSINSVNANQCKLNLMHRFSFVSLISIKLFTTFD